jgi:hypothetical protein
MRFFIGYVTKLRRPFSGGAYTPPGKKGRQITRAREHRAAAIVAPGKNGTAAEFLAAFSWSSRSGRFALSPQEPSFE